MKKIVFSLLLAIAAAVQLQAVNVKSPDGKLVLTVDVNGNRQPYYSVTRDGKEVIRQSILGIKYGNTEYYRFDKGIQSQSNKTINETYTIPHGKRSAYNNHANELTVTFGNNNGNNLQMVFRVYNDAVAFRYTMPRNIGRVQYSNEQSEFNFANFQNSISTNYEKGNSAYWHESNWANLNNGNGYSEPMLIEAGNGNYVLLTESAALSTIGTSKIVKGSQNGGLKLKLVDEGSRNVSSNSYIDTPFESPWRTLIIGTLQDIVASTAVENLSPANRIGDTSWIKPGRVSWNWAGDDGSNDCTQAVAQRYVDMAAEQGWEYTLLDEGWDGRTNVRDIVNYAKNKNVGILLWFNQNQFGNDYNSIYNKMKTYADMGVKGLKIDFFDDDRQDVLKKYENLLQAAANLKLLVNFHGCTRPSGLDRTWPNLMTMEAVYGGEMYMYWSGLISGAHTVNLLLTRNVVGGMDFTPLKFGSAAGAVKDNISWGQELALMVAFESGLQHCSDNPDNMRYSMAQPVMKILPTAWDDTRLLEARPSHYATIARRKGSNWFVAAITADARTAVIKPTFLSAGQKYYAYIYNDTHKRYDLQETILKNVTSTSEIPVTLLQNGGATIVFSTKLLNSAHALSLEAEDYNQGATISNNNEAGRYVSNIGGNRKVVFNNVKVDKAGTYAVTLYFIANQATNGYLQANNGGQTNINFGNPNVKTNNGGETGKTIGFKTVTVNLNAGLNTLTFGSNGNAPGLDHITIRPTFDYAASANDAAVTYDYTTLEAEKATLGGSAAVNNDANASAGAYVGNVGGTNNSGTIAFKYHADQAGTYSVNVYYMTFAARDMYLRVNNGEKQYSNYTETGAWDGKGIGSKNILVTLQAGDNTITLGNDNGFAPNVDRIDVGAPKVEVDPNTTVLEAEKATLAGAAIVNNDAKCSGGANVGNLGGTNNTGKATFTYHADQDGTYTVNVYYMTYLARDMYMQLNGGNKQYTNYATTGAWDGNGIGTQTFTVNLKAGDNTIAFGNDNDFAPNLDKIEVVAPEKAPDLDYTTIEAENATLKGGAVVNADANCSGGSNVGNLGGTNNTGTATFNYHADKAGTYALNIYYMTLYDRDMYIQLNGGDKQYSSFESSGAWNGTGIATKTIDVTLKAGDNTITLGNDDGYAPNVDKIEVGSPEKHTALYYTTVEAENATLNGSAVINDDAKTSNGSYVGNVGGTNNTGTISFHYNAPRADDYTVNVYYMTYADRDMYAQVNGGNKDYTSYVSTGAWNGDGIGFETLTLSLPAGDNIITLGNDRSFAPNVDKIVIGSPVKPSTATTDPTANIYFQHADQLMQKAMSYLYDKNGNHNNENDFNRYQWSNSTNNLGNTTIWPQGYGLATFANMVLASRGSARAQYYTPYIDRMFSRFDDFTVNLNGYDGYGIYPGSNDRYLDDNEWAALGEMDAYDVSHRQKYIDQAEMIARYIWGVGYDTKTGGGLYWHDSPADGLNVFITKNAASNGPGIVLLCRLYQVTGNETYLNQSKQIFQWLDNTLIDKNDYLVFDNINVNTGEKSNYKAPYTTASVLHAATLLYEITGEQHYKDVADRMARAAFNRWFKVYNSPSLGKYIHLVDFNTSDDIIVLARAYQEYAKISNEETYLNAVGNSLLNTWNERLAGNGLMNYGWSGNAGQNEWTSLGQLGYIEMYARMAQVEQEREAAEGNAATTTLEAEQATLAGGAVINADNICSNGGSVGNVGGNNNTGRITFRFDAPQAGQYKVRVYYMTAANRDMYLQLNGGAKNYDTYVNTEAWDGKGIGVKAFTLNLNAGQNTITLGNDNGFAPNVDKIEVKGLAKKNYASKVANAVINGIESYTVDNENASSDDHSVYNLNGQRVADRYSNALPKGIYIVNGKKIIKK